MEGRESSDSPLLSSALAPQARLECAVFCCRSSGCHDLSFHPLPDDPDRRKQWLQLINRLDLTHKLYSRRCALVCSIHFPPEQVVNGALVPDAVPSLELPTRRQFVLDESPVLTRLKTEIKFEPEAPPTFEKSQPSPSNAENDTPPLMDIEIKEEPSTMEVEIKKEPDIQVFQHTTQNNCTDQGQINETPHVSNLNNTPPGNVVTQQVPMVVPVNPQILFDIMRLSRETQTLNPNQILMNTKKILNSTKTLNALNPTLMNRSQMTFNSNANNPTQMLFNPTVPLNFAETSQNSTITVIPHQNQLVLKITTKTRPVLPEPTYLEHQRNIETQTDDSRANFYRKAKISAIETINILGSEDINDRSVASQTTQDLLDVLIEITNKKFSRELAEAKKELHDLENQPFMEKKKFLSSCDKFLDEKIASFVKSHAYLSNKYVGNNYPNDFKIFALKLFLWNPKCYKFVEKFFDLPSEEVIKRFRLPVRSGIDPNLMEALKVKTDQLSMLGKQCVVCFNVIQLKENLFYDVGIDYLCGLEEIDGVVGEKQAGYAILLTVRGLFTRWRQPISFALVSEKNPAIQTWLNKTIEYLFNMGLKVRALIRNLDEELLDFPIENHFEVNGEKVYNIIDFPDLLKLARDELIQNDFNREASVIKWEHVLNVYESDKTQELKLLSLTEKHVRPDETCKDDVKLATQLFRSDLAAAMHFHVVADFQDKEAKPTVQFMKKMKELTEILHSRCLSNAYRATKWQKKFLDEIVEYFKTIELKTEQGKGTKEKLVAGLQLTITAIKSLAVDLRKSNINYLLTKNLSKDFTQEYVKDIKRSELPTPIQFTREFRKLFLTNILNNTKKTSTGDDMTWTLVKISNFVKEDMAKTETTEDLRIGVDDYKIAWPSNEYVTGYIIRKCLENHTCEIFVKTLCDYYDVEMKNSDVLIKKFQFYNDKNVDKLNDIQPPVLFVKFVNLMQERFNDYYYGADKSNVNFGRNVFSIIEKDVFNMPCVSYPLCVCVKFLRTLFIRLKIFSVVKEHNRMNKTKR